MRLQKIIQNYILPAIGNISYYIDKNFILLFWIPLVFGIYQAFQLSWIADDSYISFVYSRNLWEGNGLVFNLGEKVEGYTNFLWTILLSLSFPLGIRIEDLANYLGIIFYCLTILTLPTVYSMICFVFFYHGAVFATSGLETSLYTFLLAALYRSFTKKNWNAMIALASLSVIVRPDGIIFFLGAVLLSLTYYWEKAKLLKKVYDSNLSTSEKVESQNLFVKNSNSNSDLILNSPILKFKKYIISIFPAFIFSTFIGLVYIAKAIYYGNILPNTFYAKAGSGEYFEQGFQYFYLFHKEYIIFSLFLLVGIIFSKSKFSWLLISYLLYVLYVGGDFMFARFIVPIIPIAIQLTFDLLKESKITWSQRFKNWGKLVSIFVLVLFTLSPIYRSGILAKDGMRIWKYTGIAEERNFYKNLGSRKLVYDIDALQNFRVAFFGAQAHFIYYLRPKYALESATGLTDYQLARTKLQNRGKIGHEKTASFELLLERNIDLVLSNHYPELSSYPDLIYTWNGNTLPWKILDNTKYTDFEKENSQYSHDISDLIQNPHFSLKGK